LLEDVIPVVMIGTEAENLGMEPHHELRLLISDRIGIEATVNGQAVLQERE
jgi:hypothetical protein